MPPLYSADPPILTRINGGFDTNFCINLNISFLSVTLSPLLLSTQDNFKLSDKKLNLYNKLTIIIKDKRMKNKYVLTETQKDIIKYVEENIKKEKRIISYQHQGHVGLEYALCSYFKKVEVINFDQLKKKSGKNITFRLLNIFSAIISFILKYFTKIDAGTSLSTIINNSENLYLGINKENESLKYLKIKKIPHKYTTPKFVILIEDNDIKSSNDMLCIKLLYTLIKSKKINNTILLISGQNISMLNIQNIEISNGSPQFTLNNNDIRTISSIYNLDFTNSITQNIDFIRKFGITFYIENYKYFNLLCKSDINIEDDFDKIGWLINIIFNDNCFDTTSLNQLYQLLEFVSFFEHDFNKLEVINFENNLLNAENLNIASQLEIIKQIGSNKNTIPSYYYKIQIFKKYFEQKYRQDLLPIPKQIYEYFKLYHPFQFITALELSRIDKSLLDTLQYNSLVIIAYYFNNETKSYTDNILISKYAEPASISKTIIDLYEGFKRNLKNTLQIDTVVLNILNDLINDSLNPIAACATYCMLLQILKENFVLFSKVKFNNVLAEFKATILEIEPDNIYKTYWLNHFKCQYIAYSLEDDDTEMITSRKFMHDISIAQKDEKLSNYISNNKLRSFDRIELLSFSIGLSDAENILKSLFENSQESTIIKELARINYSSALIENCCYKEAEKILTKTNITFLHNINIDTCCSYLNNLYLVQYKRKTLSLSTYLKNMKELSLYNISYSDKLIILNNYYTSMLFDSSRAFEGEKGLLDIVFNGNPFSKFYALHNLLSFYYKNNIKDKFMTVYPKIVVPKLLKSATVFFKNKFKLMYNILILNMNNVNHNDNISRDIPKSYMDEYLFCPIERWFE